MRLPNLRPQKMPRFPGYLAVIGPGIVWMALAQGSGELIWWPYIIAKYGLNFLFLLIPACLIQCPLLYSVGQYTVLTGESIFKGFYRVHRWYLGILWLLVIVHFLWFGAFASAGATALVELTGLPQAGWFESLPGETLAYQRLTWAYLMIGFFAAVVLFSPVIYTVIEKFMWAIAFITFVGLLVACLQQEVLDAVPVFVSAIFLPSDWSNMEFDVREDLTRLLTAVTFAGLGGFWLLFYSYWVGEKRCGMAVHTGRITGFSGRRENTIETVGFRPSNDRKSLDRVRQWKKFLLLDGSIGVLGNIITTLMTCLLSYALLFPKGIWPVGEQLAVVQSEFFVHSWGSWGRAVYLIVAAAFLADTWVGTADGVARIHSDCSKMLIPDLRETSRRKLYVFFFVGLTILTSLTMPLAQPGPLLLLTAVIGVVATVSYAFGLVILNLRLRTIMGAEIGPSRISTTLLIGSSTVYLFLAIAYFWSRLS